MKSERLLTQGNHSQTAGSSTVLGWLGQWVGRLVMQISVLDWIVLFYCAILLAAAWLAPESLERTVNVRRFVVLCSSFVVVLTAVRGGIVGQGRLAAAVYRVGTGSTVIGSYFLLQNLLPTVNHRVLDAELYALDLFVFRFEPALALDRFVTPAAAEWFSFFYYSYFFLLCVYVLPMLFLARSMRLLADFSISFVGVYCVGHVLYMAVPGYGPYQHLAEHFTNPLPMGFWYERVLEVVQSVGAQKDIFPSLHTAGPFTCFLFAFRHREHSPFKYAWIPTAFFAVNIIIATVFLRWHYIIDIVAGIALSAIVAFLAVHLSAWEDRRRAQRNLQPSWIPLWPGPRPEPVALSASIKGAED